MTKQLLCSVLFVLINGPIIGQERTNADFEKAVQIVRKSNVSIDWEAFRKLAEDLKESWPESSYPYCKLVYEICSKLNSTTGKNKHQGLFLQSLALTTVEKGKGPVELLVRIAMFIQPDFDYRENNMRGEEWVKSRRKITRTILEVYKKLAGEVDRKFDFEDLPSLNLIPPGGKYPSGISPNSIKEPEIRKQYEAALEANAEKVRKFSQQLTLHDLEKTFLRNLEMNAVRAYSIDPVNVEEVRSDFQEFGIPEELTNKVVKQLEARVLVLREREEKLRKLKEKPPVFFPKVSVGTLVEAKILSLDPQLQVPISFQKTKPKVADMVTLLTSKTRLHITTSDNIPRDRLAYWSIYYHNVPAWSVMDQLNHAVTQKGHWVKQENGYQLVGELKPTLESLVKDSRQPPAGEWGSFRLIFTVVNIVILAGVALLILFKRKKPKAQA